MRNLVKYLSVIILVLSSPKGFTPDSINNNDNNSLITKEDHNSKFKTSGINLKIKYKPHSRLLKERGYSGTYYNIIKNSTTISQKQKQVIKNLTDAFLKKSQNKNKYHGITEKFKSYDQIFSMLTDERKEYLTKLVNLNGSKDCWRVVNKNLPVCENHLKYEQIWKEEVKTVVLLYYNLINTFWKNINIEKILYNIEIVDSLESGVIAEVSGYVKIIIKKEAISCTSGEKILEAWKNGWYSTYSYWHILYHELAHTIYYYDLKQFNQEHVGLLISFLKSKIINFHLYKQNLDDETLLKVFSSSNYGIFSGSLDILAESFTNWITVEPKMRTKSWELLNEFYLSYLPEKRAMYKYQTKK